MPFLTIAGGRKVKEKNHEIQTNSAFTKDHKPSQKYTNRPNKKGLAGGDIS